MSDELRTHEVGLPENDRNLQSAVVARNYAVVARNFPAAVAGVAAQQLGHGRQQQVLCDHELVRPKFHGGIAGEDFHAEHKMVVRQGGMYS